jgi:hypothetical protein
MKRLAENKEKSNNISESNTLNLAIIAQLVFIKTGKRYSIPYISMILNGKRKANKIRPILKEILKERDIGSDL